MYTFKTKPYKHQQDILQKSWNMEVAALLMEMGTGKTKVVIDTIGMLNDEKGLTGVLVIAPKGAYHQWPQEIDIHLNEDVRERTAVYLWSPSDSRTNTDKQEAILAAPGNNSLSVVVMNAEALSTQKGFRFAAAFLRKHKSMMVLDEASMFKNPKAIRTKNAIALGGYAQYRRIMTGTPVTKSPLDLFAPFKFLHAGILGGSFVQFRSRYAVLEEMYVGGGRVIKVVKGYVQLDELKQRIAPFSFRILKEECLDLPPKVYQTWIVDLGPMQRKYYNQMMEKCCVELESGGLVTAPLVITQLARLRQITCGLLRVWNPAAEEVADLVPVEDNQREDALMELLETTSGKVVIFCNYRDNAHSIEKRLKKLLGSSCAASYTGETKQKDRAAIQTAFNDPNSGLDFLIVTESTGKYGLNMKAGTIIFYSNDFDLDCRLQAEARCEGIGRGAGGKLTIIDIVAKETIDEKIRAALLAKKQVADLVTGDKWREWFSKGEVHGARVRTR